MSQPLTAAASLHAALLEATRLEESGRLKQAAEAYVAILRRVPDLPATWFNLARVCRGLRQYEAALAAYEQAIARRIERPEEAYLNRGVIYSDCLYQPDAAERELRAALAANPTFVPALMNYAGLHEDLGRRDDAIAMYEQVLALQPAHANALARRAGAARVTSADDPIVDRLEHALAQSGTNATDRASLGFALGTVLDRVGAYERAFKAFAEANLASRESMPADAPRYDRAAVERAVDQVIAVFDGSTPRATARDDGPRPLFICGMFRSGSTLTERVLAGHARVQSGGELDFMPTLAQTAFAPFPDGVRALSATRLDEIAGYYLEALAKVFPGDRHVTDKRPDNFLLIGLIKSIFPRARIVHTTRDPLDNCLSVFFLHADHSVAYALDLLDTGHYYAQYRRLMAHWRRLYGDDILDFSYESLVAEPDASVRKLLEHCRLEWQDGLVEFDRRPGMVKTASVWQVRRPLYADSVGRWRNYATQLEPLREYLAAAGVT